MKSPFTPGDYDVCLVLVEAIERHRDARYPGGEVPAPLDATLYTAALWFRDNQQEIEASAE